ncbi:MAG: precorrin-6y C5,15-methyltransferase (decarboxylating) subunit CbiE [Paracoccaceae bacterium]
MAPWLDIVGIGEDGMAGLSPAARAAVEGAEVILGGDRHHRLSDRVRAERIAWPSPFDAMIDRIRGMKGRRAVVLVTGDPLWYSVGARIVRAIPPEDIRFHPQLSAFQWAAARMGWSLADLETLTVHGRPAEQILPFLAPEQRLLVLTEDASSPGTLARLLAERGFGPTEMTVLAALGGPEERRIAGRASDWAETPPAVPDFHTLALDCRAEAGARPLPRIGLPDDAFEHDGQITKREIRVLTLAALAPRRGARLWDLGTGSGSVAIEWLRADRDTEAVGLEPDPERLARAERNARRLGAPRLRLVAGRSPDALEALPAPDAVFFGGGLSEAAVDAARSALRPFGRLVANAVTLESEALLARLHARHGGTLARLSVARAEPVGRRTAWRPAMPVTQWVLGP